MSEEKIIGGTREDRQKVLKQQQLYLDANAKFDWEVLRDKIEFGVVLANERGIVNTGFPSARIRSSTSPLPIASVRLSISA